MNKKLMLSLITCSTLPVVAVACSKTHIAKNIYIIEKNESNPNYNGFEKVSGVYGKRKTLHDSLIGNYLLRYKYIGQVNFDYLNNYFFANGISARFLKFGLINKIEITDKDNNVSVFDSDDDDIFKNPKDHLKRDINRGYKNYIYTLQSQNPRSINSANFKQKLGKAKNIKFFFKSEQYWFDNQGKKTIQSITPNDLRQSIISANLNQEQIHNLNLLGFDNDLDNENNFNSKFAQFNLTNITNSDLFLSEIIENKMFSAYKANHYAGAYFLQSNDLKHTKYKSLNNDPIEYVIIKYNPVGKIDNQTHRIHILNEYEQGLVSAQDISIFNDIQQNELIRKFKANDPNVKLNIIRTKNNSANQYLTFNLNPNLEAMDDLYKLLMYGTKDNNKIDWRNFYSGLGFEFRNNITQIIDKFSLNYTVNKTQYYDNFISAESLISNAKNTNYVRIIDAIDHLNKNILFLGDKVYEYYSEENKNHYYTKDSYLDIYEQLKAPKFEQIKTNIKQMLDKFYATLNTAQKSQKIQFIIPLDLEKIETKLLSVLKNLFNSIDERLEIKIVDLDNNLAKVYYTNFNANQDNTIDYLIDVVKTQNILKALDYIDFNRFVYLNKFKQFMLQSLNINNFGDDLDDLAQNSADFEAKIKKAIFDLHSQYNYFDIIKIINEIKIVYSVPYNVALNVDLANFRYELIQPWFIKPTRDDELIYFEDIKIGED
ncbi:hypothetical protein NXS15_02515 [Mycoplasma sp. CSL7475-4]|uniref:OppA family ABC transporter substrate-binding lipoprotein n=1 Tax=Mycoplasma sp. CSL7475-4 TaxID=2973942 RepID=UPI00216AE61C|nr:hypothetical protein [Mycoplasma sp. CSL7475-4]MCS4536986.1 hypothetical protein [Mycoplasma sp. CSL7475-4]